jgi:hypothetical protein
VESRVDVLRVDAENAVSAGIRAGARPPPRPARSARRRRRRVTPARPHVRRQRPCFGRIRGAHESPRRFTGVADRSRSPV